MQQDDTEQAPYTPQKEVYSVSQLNREARQVLEGQFGLLWVEGEISNFACPASGHWYFSLKDAQAQVRCAMFRNRNQHVPLPENGKQVLIRARVGLYEGRGEFQLIVEHLEEAGDGALRRAFDALKNKLQQQGLFDPDNKQPIPALPRCIGVITSPTGAAIRDVLSVLRKRFPAIPVIIYPSSVQGETAAAELARMIKVAEQRQECDVLLLTRGGGSLEDLWAFNEEVLARAVYQCKIPIVSAVGHEIDTSIADLVADLRAPTPSAAAELLSPDQAEYLAILSQKERMLVRLWQHKLQQLQQRMDYLATRLKQLHPGVRLTQWQKRQEELKQRLLRSQQHNIESKQRQLQALAKRLQNLSPVIRIKNLRQHQLQLSRRLQQAMKQQLQQQQQRLSHLSHTLDTLSPLSTLQRGYSIIQNKDKQIINKLNQVDLDEPLTARLSDGLLNLRVEKKS